MFVQKDGDELQVEDDELPVTAYHNVGVGSTMTDYEVHGPTAVTKDLAERVQQEFQIDLESHGIEIIDPEADSVDVL